MVDLQRSMGCIWNIVRANLQEGPRNSDTDPPLDSLSSEKFSRPDFGENFIRADLIQLELVNWNLGVTIVTPGLIDVLLEPALLLEFRDKQHGLVGGPGTALGDDIDQRALAILCHPLGVAADVDVGALRQPRPDFAADFAHAVLHVEL